MSAPDRSQWVKNITEIQASLPFPSEEARREFLLTSLIPALNRMETLGEWGYLVKLDKGNHIPADVIVWKETLEHFDVLTDKGPMWKAHGPIRSSWRFGQSGVNPPAPPVPHTPTPENTTPSGPGQTAGNELVSRVMALQEQVRVLTESSNNAIASFTVAFEALKNRPFPTYRGGNWRTGGLVLTPEE